MTSHNNSKGITLDQRIQAILEEMRERGYTFTQFIHNGTQYDAMLVDPVAPDTKVNFVVRNGAELVYKLILE